MCKLAGMLLRADADTNDMHVVVGSAYIQPSFPDQLTDCLEWVPHGEMCFEHTVISCAPLSLHRKFSVYEVLNDSTARTSLPGLVHGSFIGRRAKPLLPVSGKGDFVAHVFHAVFSNLRHPNASFETVRSSPGIRQRHGGK